MNTLSLDNRNQAYYSIIDSLPKKRRRIFQIINENPNSSAFEISQYFRIPINQVVPRITELKTLFLICETGSKTNQNTRKQNTLYRVVKDLSERIDLINERFVELRSQKEQLEHDYIKNLTDLTKSMILKEIHKINTQINFLDKFLTSNKSNK